MAEVGMIDPKDPRFIKTVDALEAVLCDGPYMRRYEAPDDFGLPETSFNICAFWRIDALARIGRTAQAREIFNALLAVRKPARPALRRHPPRDRPTVGQLPADLFDGRHHQRSDAALGAVGLEDLMAAPGLLVVVSNRDR